MNKVQDLTDEQIGAAFRKLLGGTESHGAMDLDLLQKQKIDMLPFRVENEDEALKGVVHFLDAFQDICVDDLHIWKFPGETG